MLELIAAFAYVLFVAATAALIWAVGELAHGQEPNARRTPPGVNPHSVRL